MYRLLLILGTPPDRLTVVKSILLALVGLALSSAAALAEEDWTTTDGTNYQDVKVVRVEDDAVTILHKNGGALVFLNKLPPALQQRFDYDPIKAQAAAKARSKADADNALALQKEIDIANAIKKKEQIQNAKALGYTNAPPK
jgi:hypothetical protein